MNALAQPQPDSSGSPDLALLFAAVQAFPESLAITESGLLLYANWAWARLFEYSHLLQVQGRAVAEFIPGHLFHGAGADRDNWNGTCPAGEFAHPRQDGTQLHLRVDGAGFRMRGRAYQVISTRDVSAQKEVEKRLPESQRLVSIGRLVGGVAHDFNNLLTGFMLYCDLLIGGLEKDSRFRQYAKEMRTAGEQGAKLVQQLLAVARPAGEESHGFALNDVVTGIEDLASRLIGENIVLTTELADDLGSVRMDPAQVQQILLNLVLNARDAMFDGGQITLTTRICTDYLPSGPDPETATYALR